MRRLVVNSLAVATVLASASIGVGQSLPAQPGQPAARPPVARPRAPGAPPGQPGARPPAKDKTQSNKSKLEEMLTEALKNNPDLRVAAANVTLAEAELNRTRLQVTQKVIALHAALLSQ